MKNVIVVGGNSMADLRNGIDAALAAMEKGGMMYCVGASSVADLRAAKAAMETMGVGGITNPNYTAPKGCGMGCPCGCGCNCEDEDEYEDEDTDLDDAYENGYEDGYADAMAEVACEDEDTDEPDTTAEQMTAEELVKAILRDMGLPIE